MECSNMTPGFEALCAIGGNSCVAAIVVGPSGNDVCEASQNPLDQCATHEDGWCVRLELGACTQAYLLGEPAGCFCVPAGDPVQAGARTYCTTGSSVCGGGVATPPGTR